MKRWIPLLTAALMSTTFAQSAVRLVFVDAKTPSAQVLEVQEKKTIASFTVPGPAAGIYATSGQHHAVLIHRNENRVTFIHSGLRLLDHGNHQDLIKTLPHVLQTLNVGRQPTHFFSHEDQMVIFNDQDGTNVLLNESQLGLSLDYQTVPAEIPDHGAPALLGKHLLIGYLKLNRVDAFDLESQKVVQQFPNCPALHGETRLNNTVAFGCSDGVLLISESKGQLSSQKISNPAGTPEGTRVGTVLSHPKASTFFGNWGKGVVRIDPINGLKPIALGSNYIKGNFSADGNLVLVLTADGVLHEILPEGTVQRQTRVVTPVDLTVAGAPRPSFAVHGHWAFITDPSVGEIVQFDVQTGQVTERFKVGGTPTGIVALSAEGTEH